MLKSKPQKQGKQHFLIFYWGGFIEISLKFEKVCLKCQNREPDELFKPLSATSSVLRESYVQNVILIRSLFWLKLWCLITTSVKGQNPIELFKIVS